MCPFHFRQKTVDGGVIFKGWLRLRQTLLWNCRCQDFFSHKNHGQVHTNEQHFLAMFVQLELKAFMLPTWPMPARAPNLPLSLSAAIRCFCTTASLLLPSPHVICSFISTFCHSPKCGLYNSLSSPLPIVLILASSPNKLTSWQAQGFSS